MKIQGSADKRPAPRFDLKKSRKNSEETMKRFVRYILNWYHVHDGLEILLFAVCWSAFAIIGYTFISEIVNRILT